MNGAETAILLFPIRAIKTQPQHSIWYLLCIILLRRVRPHRFLLSSIVSRQGGSGACAVHQPLISDHCSVNNYSRHYSNKKIGYSFAPAVATNMPQKAEIVV